MIRKEDLRSVGKFQKTHALKGELNMISDIDPEYYLEGNPLIMEYDGIMVPYYAESIRPKGNTSYLVKIDGIDSEKEAAVFVNKEIYIKLNDALQWLKEEIEEEEELLGYTVEDISTGEILGIVSDIENSTSNVLFIVENDEEEEYYLPFNNDLIIEINEDEHKIKMKLPDGLRDINKKKNK